MTKPKPVQSQENQPCGPFRCDLRTLKVVARHQGMLHEGHQVGPDPIVAPQRAQHANQPPVSEGAVHVLLAGLLGKGAPPGSRTRRQDAAEGPAHAPRQEVEAVPAVHPLDVAKVTPNGLCGGRQRVW